VIYRGITQILTYREVLHLEMDRHLAGDVAGIKRPPWWRPWARKLYAMKVRALRDYHASNMYWLLAEEDPRRRAIMACLINWRLPREYADDLAAVAESSDPEIQGMLVRLINLKLGTNHAYPVNAQGGRR
jgi:hypothetical protein